MRKTHLILAGLAVAVVLLLALAVVSCGGGGTTTTSAPGTTASTAPTPTSGATTTASGVTTTAGGATTTAGSGSTGAIDAAKLYTTNCSGCHKDVPAATAEQAKAIIESGKADMPSFKSRLTADEIAALAAYVGAGGK